MLKLALIGVRLCNVRQFIIPLHLEHVGRRGKTKTCFIAARNKVAKIIVRIDYFLHFRLCDAPLYSKNIDDQNNKGLYEEKAILRE